MAHNVWRVIVSVGSEWQTPSAVPACFILFYHALMHSMACTEWHVVGQLTKLWIPDMGNCGVKRVMKREECFLFDPVRSPACTSTTTT